MKWSRVPGPESRWVCDTNNTGESPVQLLGTLLDSLPVVTAHYLLQRDLRLKFFRDAVQQEKELQAHRLTEEARNALPWEFSLEISLDTEKDVGKGPQREKGCRNQEASEGHC